MIHFLQGSPHEIGLVTRRAAADISVVSGFEVQPIADPAAAQRALAPHAGDPGKLAVLRRALGEARPGKVARLEDAAVFRAVADLLVSGELLLVLRQREVEARALATVTPPTPREVEQAQAKRPPPPKPTTAKLKVLVLDRDGKGVEGVTVVVTGKKSSPKPTDKGKGLHDCGEVEPDTFKITVEKEWHVDPDTTKEKPEKEEVVAAGDDKTVKFKLHPVEIHMYLDADRDGKPDPKQDGMNDWKWGKTGKGAIVLCNNDDDHPGAKKNKSDHEDEQVNDHNDSDELAPLEFRSTGAKPPKTWKAKLEILGGREDELRVFDGRAAKSKELLGKTKGSSYSLPKLDFDKLTYWMEATQYADKDWADGEIGLKFTLTDSKGKKKEEEGKVRVAPWLMLHHGVEAEEVFVIRSPGGGRQDNKDFIKDLKAALAGGPAVNDKLSHGDRWVQDLMEIGYSSLPHEARGIHGINAIARNAQARPVADEVKKYRDRDLGYQEPVPPAGRGTANSFGNLEVTPPCTSASGKRYPFGRIYYGPDGGSDTFEPDYVEFLKKQVVQKPFEIDTEWLLVGHVDEIVTFVPDATKRNGKDFKALVASPNEAYRILEHLRASGQGKAKMLIGRELEHADSSATPDQRSFEITVEDLLDKGFQAVPGASGRPALKGIDTAARLRGFNDGVQDKIDATIHKKFSDEIGYIVPRTAKEIRKAEAAVRKAEEAAKAAEKDAEKTKKDAEKTKKEAAAAAVEAAAKKSTPEAEKLAKTAEEAKKKADESQKRAEEAKNKATKAREETQRLADEEAKKKAEDDKADVVRVPVLFLPYRGLSPKALAMTAGMVNMLVVGRTCVFPKPYGPVVGGNDKFEEDLEKKLKGLGATPKSVDDWYTYHALQGEVHCGTNTRRKVPNWKWWEFEP